MTQGAGGGRRSRIVIDVSSAQAQARKKSWRKSRVGRYLSATALIIIGVVLVLLVAGYAWWRSFEKSPAYSLALLVDAAQRDDKQAVDSLIDPDKIADGFVPQIIATFVNQNPQLTPQARAQLSNVIPLLLPRVRETVRDDIMRDIKVFAGEPNEPVSVLAFGIRNKTQVEESGDAATVKHTVADRNLEVAMHREGERWKVVAIKDNQLATDITGRLASSIPNAAPTPVPPHRKGR